MKKEESVREIDIEVNIADHFFSRLKGLMFVSTEIEKPLLITPCSRVHSCFMKQPIDVVYLNKEHEIVGKERLAPWKMGEKFRTVSSVLEGKTGFAKGFKIGESSKANNRRLDSKKEKVEAMVKENNKKKKEESQKGQALVEFALIIPILLLLLLIPIDLYRVINTKMILNTAASESIAKLNYEVLNRDKVSELVEKDFGDKLDPSKVEIPHLEGKSPEARDYTYYVYSSELAEENPGDFQKQFENRQSNYQYKEVELQLAYDVKPISLGSLFIGESFKVETPIYRRNVYVSGYSP